MLRRPCSGLDRCPFVLATSTGGASGAWNVTLPAGQYFLTTNRTSDFGGTDYPLSLPSGSGGSYGPISLQAEPFVAYGNVTFELPAWNNLSTYAANCNAALPCKSGSPAGPYGGQQPLLSWTADGAFYVNATDRLVFYSFPNRTVRDIAPWQPLYDNLMSYNGIENTEWITADGTWVYEIGCSALCTDFSSIELYAVNTTTGAVFSHIYTGLVVLDTISNVQVDMIGENGNLSVAALDEASGEVIGYNLWNQTQWNLGTLPFFEANNLYWIPLLNAELDVRAEGSDYDEVVEMRLAGPAPGTSLVPVADEIALDGFPVNGVDGVVYNLTAQTLDFTAEDTAGTAVTYQARLSNGGLVDNLSEIWGDPRTTFGEWPNVTAYPNVVASEHRPSLLLSGDAFAGYGSGWFQNVSPMVDPSDGVWASTNVSFAPPTASTGPYRGSGPSPASLEGLFYNTSYAILPWSYDCRTNASECPILGNTSGVHAPGTIWWSWRSGSPEFPFPADAPLGEVAPPAPPTNLTLAGEGRSLTANWTSSATPGSERLAYELSYVAPEGVARSVWLGPTATSATLGPVAPETWYNVSLTAWNLHGPSVPVNGTLDTPALTGKLNLAVSPSWANLTVDGIPVSLVGGQTTLSVDVGMITVNASAAGYEPFSARANITFGNTTDLTVNLSGIAPRLLGTVSPAFAQLDVDGVPEPLQASGAFDLTLSPGEHALTLRAYGYDPLGPLNISLSYGEVLTEPPLALARAYGWVVGSVTPIGASVTLDGAPINLSDGVLDLRLPTGLYWFDVFDGGYAPAVVGPLNVTPLNETRFVENLVPLDGRLELSVTPATALASLDNASLPLMNGTAVASLTPGPHEIDLRAPGFDPYRLDRSVAPNETLVLNVTLVRSVGDLEGWVRPAGARVFLDGSPVGIDYLGGFNLTVPAGTHALSATAPGFRSSVLNVTVPDHGVRPVNLTMIPLPSSTPRGSQIALVLVLGSGAGLLAAIVSVWAVRPRRASPDRASR